VPPLEQEQHVWLQVPLGTEWVDLDPALPNSQQGQTIATAGPDVLDALPDELRHRIALTVTAETISGTALAEGTIMEFTGFADELAGRPMVFLHAKPSGIEGMGVTLAGTLTGEVQYVPILDAGGRTQVGDPITFSGGGGLLEDIGDGGSTRSGEATAEWLEIRSESPDGVVNVARRVIFDRVGAEARRAGSIDVEAIPLVELVSNGDETINEFPPLQTAQAITVATGPTSLEQLSRVTELEEGPIALMAGSVLFHIGRDGASSALGPRHGFRMFLDRPNVIIHGETGVVPSDEERRDYFLDMPLRSFGALPVSGREAGLPPQLVAGVISNVAERLAVGDGLEGDYAPLGEVVSVGGVFERAATQGIPSRVVRTTVPDDLAIDAEAAAVLARALEQGWVAIVPESAVEIDRRPRSGWWLVDPTSGRTSDQMDDGRGSSGTEHPISVAIGLYAKGKWVRATICLLLFIKLLVAFIKTIYTISAWPFFSNLFLHALLHKPIHWLGCH
jgi:hypothetical protein